MECTCTYREKPSNWFQFRITSPGNAIAFGENKNVNKGSGSPLIRRNFLPSYHSNEKFLGRQVRTRNKEAFSDPLYMPLMQAESLHKREL